MDITSAVHEVVEKKPDITRWEAVRSGMNVGRAAMGTMTTTLLLAYSGGYIALLMVFMAQGTPISHIFNYKYVAAEIIHTVIVRDLKELVILAVVILIRALLAVIIHWEIRMEQRAENKDE